jgi:hypothetical protein
VSLSEVRSYQGIQDVFPEQTPLDRSALNSWEDRRVVNWVKQTGKKKLAMAGLRTGVRLQMPVLSALADGYEVYFLTDASGGASREAHDMAVQRMIKAGASPITTWSYVSELQRDWPARTRRRSHQIVRGTRRRLRSGIALGVAVAGPEGRHPLMPGLEMRGLRGPQLRSSKGEHDDSQCKRVLGAARDL